VTYRVRYHQRANDDLRRINGWITEFSGQQVARRKLLEIRASIRKLSVFPHRGARRDQILPGLRLLPVDDQTVASYVIDEANGEVLVLTVSYAGSDWMTRSLERS
jgi:toxin ParE1/3/4